MEQIQITKEPEAVKFGESDPQNRLPIEEWSIDFLNEQLQIAYSSGFFNDPTIEIMKNELKRRITT